MGNEGGGREQCSNLATSPSEELSWPDSHSYQPAKGLVVLTLLVFSVQSFYRVGSRIGLERGGKKCFSGER